MEYRGLALPTALLIIGTSISTSLMRAYIRQVSAVMFIKLACMPAFGLAFFILAGLPAEEFLPGLILLGSPTATIAYVMGREMHGDTDFAVTAISASTLVSAITYGFLLWIAVRV